ncbi:GNAT family N-acetyltransferase [Romboutsia lituseburensis]|uniref:GNAT family N-acetyltransferase n=1 Tax=Romboutsia lituseburensis TaxID=1537 RepID=UPI00215A2D6F|nr:GNAT family N-acetyltransferase [Romboutsia lituseburensis]MCR8744068.1 GNAT family N-acetyltransferase [Romboutsia lituseburensis]
MKQILELEKYKLIKLAKVLTLSLEKDPLYINLFPDENKRKKYLDRFFEMRIKYGLKYGRVYTISDKYEGVLIILPGEDVMTPIKVFRSGGIKLIGTLGRNNMKKLVDILDYLYTKEKLYMRDNFIKISLIGINPIYQNKGYGSHMIKYILKQIEGQNISCYLETQNFINLNFYEKLGFKILETGNMPVENVSYWCMMKK